MVKEDGGSPVLFLIDAERGKPLEKSEAGGLGKHSRKSLLPKAAEGALKTALRRSKAACWNHQRNGFPYGRRGAVGQAARTGRNASRLSSSRPEQDFSRSGQPAPQAAACGPISPAVLLSSFLFLQLLAESFPAFHQFLLPGPQFFHSLGQLQRFLIVAGSLRIAEPAGQLGGFPV